MSIFLEVALGLASLSVVLLVVCLIPALFLIKRQLDILVQQSEQLKGKLEILVNDSNELVRNVNTMVSRVNCQLNTSGEVVDTVKTWTDRTGHIVDAVGSIIEPPIFSAAEKINLLRRGVVTFLQVLFRPKSN